MLAFGVILCFRFIRLPTPRPGECVCVCAVSAFCFYLSRQRIINTNAWNKLLLLLWPLTHCECATRGPLHVAVCMRVSVCDCVCSSLYFSHYDFYGLALLELLNLSSSCSSSSSAIFFVCVSLVSLARVDRTEMR